MLVQTSELWGFGVSAIDGDSGHIQDLQVDDHGWAVSDIVVSRGRWLNGELVIIPPDAVAEVDRTRGVVRVTLTTDHMAGAPSVTTHPSVSWQRRFPPYRYLGLPFALGGFDPWDPVFAMAGIEEWKAGPRRRLDLHLRSLRALTHYRLEAAEGEGGHVEDWLVDVHRWRVPYAVVRVSGGLLRKHVLVPVLWLGPVSWTDRAIQTDLPRDAIVHAPDYQPGQPPDVEYQIRLRGWYASPVAPHAGVGSEGPQRTVAARRGR